MSSSTVEEISYCRHIDECRRKYRLCVCMLDTSMPVAAFTHYRNLANKYDELGYKTFLDF